MLINSFHKLRHNNADFFPSCLSKLHSERYGKNASLSVGG